MKVLPTPILVVCVALAYAASGWLSLHITVPPHYVSVLFIPTGVALGAVLLSATLVLYALYRKIVKSELSLG